MSASESMQKIAKYLINPALKCKPDSISILSWLEAIWGTSETEIGFVLTDFDIKIPELDFILCEDRWDRLDKYTTVSGSLFLEAGTEFLLRRQKGSSTIDIELEFHREESIWIKVDKDIFKGIAFMNERSRRC